MAGGGFLASATRDQLVKHLTEAAKKLKAQKKAQASADIFCGESRAKGANPVPLLAQPWLGAVLIMAWAAGGPARRGEGHSRVADEASSNPFATRALPKRLTRRTLAGAVGHRGHRGPPLGRRDTGLAGHPR